MKKLIGAVVLGAALLAPSIVLGQTSTTGLLNVYVQVLSNQAGYTLQPANFNVSVSGLNPSISNFAGSIQGTLVTLSPGAYSAVVTNTQGYTATYSVGCNNTLAAGQTHTCVITMAPATYGWPTTPYPYSGQNFQPLTCRTETPTVALGQTARFSTTGGSGGTYNWFTDNRNYPNVGPVLTITFDNSGTHTVRVTNSAQTATCIVTVNSSYYPVVTPPTAPVYPAGQGYPALSSSYVPRFPNTGFEPKDAAQLAFALVLLMGASIAAYPYGRKAIALAVR